MLIKFRKAKNLISILLQKTKFVIATFVKKAIKTFSKPIIIYPTIYIGVMIAFAVIYMFLPNEFYHDTVKYESSLTNDAISILDGIKNTILTSQKDLSNSKIIVNDKVYIDKDTLNVHSIKFVDSNDCSFDINITVYDNTDFGLVQMGSTLLCSFDLTGYMKINDIVMIPLNVEKQNLPFANLDFEYNDIVNTLFPMKEDGFKVTHIDMPTQLYNKIIGLQYANNGFPSKSSGQFVRMLYLSTFTITTASQGDILPITTRARVFVAVETIIGVLIIGLFFNSLANSIGNSKK